MQLDNSIKRALPYHKMFCTYPVAAGLSTEAVGAVAVLDAETSVSLGERYLANPCAACRVVNILFACLFLQL